LCIFAILGIVPVGCCLCHFFGSGTSVEACLCLNGFGVFGSVIAALAAAAL